MDNINKERQFKIKITQDEHLQLFNISGLDRSLSTSFGPSGVFVTEQTECWAIKELAVLRGLIPQQVVKAESLPQQNKKNLSKSSLAAKSKPRVKKPRSA